VSLSLASCHTSLTPSFDFPRKKGQTHSGKGKRKQYPRMSNLHVVFQSGGCGIKATHQPLGHDNNSQIRAMFLSNARGFFLDCNLFLPLLAYIYLFSRGSGNPPVMVMCSMIINLMGNECTGKVEKKSIGIFFLTARSPTAHRSIPFFFHPFHLNDVGSFIVRNERAIIFPEL
jgi:hypothetical protein